MPLPFHAAYAPSTCTASCLSVVTLSSRHTCQTTASSTAKDIGKCAAMVHLTLHKVLLFPSGSVADRPVCRATPGSDAHKLWTVVYQPKPKEFLSRSQQPTSELSATERASLWAAAQSSFILVDIVNLNHTQTLKQNTRRGRVSVFPPHYKCSETHVMGTVHEHYTHVTTLRTSVVALHRGASLPGLPRALPLFKAVRSVLQMRTRKGAENERFWFYAAPFLN